MKNSRKAAHLLAGSIMTAATIVGGAGIADARTVASEEKENTSFAYNKIEWTYTELDAKNANDGFYKIDDFVRESANKAAAAYYKIATIPGE